MRPFNPTSKNIPLALLLTLVGVVFPISWNLGNAYLPFLSQRFSFSSFLSSSTVDSFVTLGISFGSVISLFLLKKINTPHLYLLGLLMVGLTAFGLVFESTVLFLLSRFILGLGGKLLSVSLHPLLIHYFLPKQRNKLLAWNTLSFNLGLVLSIFLAPWLKNLLPWNIIMLGTNLSFFLLALFFILALRNSSSLTQTSPPILSLKKQWASIHKKVLFLCAFMETGALAIFTIMMTFYATLPYAHPKLVFVFVLFGTFLSLFFTQIKTSPTKILLFVGSIQLVSLSALLFTASPLLTTISVAFLGGALGFPLTFIFIFIHDHPSTKQENIGVFISIFWGIAYLLSSLLLSLYAFTKDNITNSWGSPLLLIFINALFIVCALLLYREERYSTL